MSFFRDDEIVNLTINKMILHVVGDSAANFEPQPELVVQEDLFFLDRIVSAAGSSVHQLDDQSQIIPIIEGMGDGSLTFEKGGQELSRLFYRDHVKQSTKGAFFVFKLITDEKSTTQFYCLVKYDYRQAVELSSGKDGKSILRSIIQAFVKEKKSIQKFCILRYENGEVDKVVTASDRMKDAPDLTDYFEKYLGAYRSKTAEELTKNLNDVLRSAASDLKDLLPSKNISLAVLKAKAALSTKDVITNDDIFDALLHAADRPDDEEKRAQIEKIVKQKIKKHSLTDVDFKPHADVLKVQPRQLIRTAERVSLEYPGDQLGRSVFRKELADGGFEITIKTSEPLVEDTPLAEGRRR